VNRGSAKGEDRKQRDADDAETTADLRGALPAKAGNRLVYRHITGAVLGAFYSIHSELGSGFLEAVYESALVVLLKSAGLRVEQQVTYEILFRGQSIGTYRADLVVGSQVIVEIKAARCIIQQHTAQLLNYLKASQLPVGLLLNFGERAELGES
jgi:GxxExxY protein